jgi:hypothetical protein
LIAQPVRARIGAQAKSGADMKHWRFVLAACCGAIAATTAMRAQTSGSQPLNHPVTTNGIEAVCTGVAVDAADMPRWNAYPLKVVAAGKGGQFLGGETVTVRKDGKVLTSVTCDGPWVLFKLSAGSYEVGAALDGKTATAKTIVPATGQARVVLRFLETGGAVSPEHKP